MYQVEFTPQAQSHLAGLNKPIAQRILTKIRWLAQNFEIIRPEPLTGDWKGVFKLRVGNYRVIYTFNRAQRRIIVHVIEHRRKVYKRK